MFQEIIDIGKAIDKEYKKDEIAEPILGSDQKGIILFIRIEKDDFVDVSAEEYDPSKINKYLYRRGSSKGTDITPTSKITEVKKTFENKIIKWFNEHADDKYLEKIGKIIYAKKDKILENLEKKYNEYQSNYKQDKSKKKKLGFAISLKLDGKYLGEIDSVVRVAKADFEKKMMLQDSKSVKPTKAICMFCGQEKEVSPIPASTSFKFSTIDKVGFVTHLDQSLGWKNISICMECGFYLNKGKSFLDENTFSFGKKVSVYVIPKVVFPQESIDNNVLEKIRKISVSQDEEHEKRLETMRQLICEDDFDIQSIRQLNRIQFIYLFFKKIKERFLILGVSDDVYPYWLARMFDVRYLVINAFFYKEDFLKRIFGKNYIGNYMFKEIGYEFGKFLDVYEEIPLVVKILSQKKISYSFVISKIIEKIRASYGKENKLEWCYLTLDGMKLVTYLKLLDLLNYDTKGGIMTYEYEKKGSFMVGVLTSKLLSVQYVNRGDSPFERRLFGLNLNEKKIKDLFIKVKSKLSEYDVAYPDYERVAAEYLLKSKEKWHTSDDLISFYFTCGLCLGRGLKDLKELDEILKEVI
ncbi:MAG: TM1802 family CRISPR-associated protein [Leptospiraceae bacterium]|nr:TM1802 family CRISPR-associated protein [Leptospiraceae bacterium]